MGARDQLIAWLDETAWVDTFDPGAVQTGDDDDDTEKKAEP